MTLSSVLVKASCDAGKVLVENQMHRQGPSPAAFLVNAAISRTFSLQVKQLAASIWVRFPMF